MPELFDILKIQIDKTNPGEILTEDPAWTTINDVTLVATEDRLYEYGFSLSYTMTDLNDSAQFRYSTDGGATWTNFSHEVKDTTNITPLYYAFPKPELAGTLRLTVEATKEDGGQNMSVAYADAWISVIG